MATVDELAALYANVMVVPTPGPGVCTRCLTFTDGYSQCYACSTTPGWLDTVAPISYSVAHGQLHHALASYKRLTGPVAERLQLQLAAILWRFLAIHEPCVAREAGVVRFTVVTTVPSTGVGVAWAEQAGGREPLERLVAELCGPTRDRHQRLLERSGRATAEHDFDEGRFRPLRGLHGESVLLIDDTWTTGANAQSAAAALKRAGAGHVAAVVLGRHLKREWRDNATRLRALAAPFEWDVCARCSAPAIASAGVCPSQ